MEPWCKQSFGEGPNKRYNGQGRHNWETEAWNYFNTGLIVFDRAFAQLMVDNVNEVQLTDKETGEVTTGFPDGWGEQHYFNYVIDKHEYPVLELPRKTNELTGLSNSKGEWISHYAAPWGRSKLSQREIHPDQASFQRKYLKGGIINIGCNEDWANLKRDFKAFNVDIFDTDPTTGVRNDLDEIADARDLPEKYREQFDTAVLGEILEHFDERDRRKSLNSAKMAIKPDGWINMTFPYDTRDLPEQRPGHSTDIEYTPGVSAFHKVPLHQSMVLEDLKACGLKPLRVEEIHYPFDNVKGTGILACRNDNEACVCGQVKIDAGDHCQCGNPGYWQRVLGNMELIFETQ